MHLLRSADACTRRSSTFIRSESSLIAKQAQKYIGEGGNEIYDKIVNAEDPFKAKEISKEHEKGFGDKSYWNEWHEERKLDAMRRAVKEKFEQHPDLKKRLIDTGDAGLVENESSNSYW